MKVLGATTKWIWWSMLMLSLMVVMTSSWAAVTPKFTTVSYEINSYDPDSYGVFLNELRGAVADTTRACDLRSTRGNPSANQAYVLAELKVSSGQRATLGIDAKDLYVWAYRSTMKGKDQASFLKDAPKGATDNLFKDVQTTRTTRFGGNYNDLSKAAETTRKDIRLTFESLENDVIAVNKNTEPTTKAEAVLFLRAIQMVAEAARFSRMQAAIVSGDINIAAVRNEFLAYQNTWDGISQAIHRATTAKPACQAITPPLVISSTDFRKNVTNVNQIRDEMGLLKYKTPKNTLIAAAGLMRIEEYLPLFHYLWLRHE